MGSHTPVDGDAESCAWSPHVLETFAVSTEAGSLLGFDVRHAKKPLYSIALRKKKTRSPLRRAFCVCLTSVFGIDVVNVLCRVVSVWRLSLVLQRARQGLFVAVLQSSDSESCCHLLARSLGASVVLVRL